MQDKPAQIIHLHTLLGSRDQQSTGVGSTRYWPNPECLFQPQQFGGWGRASVGLTAYHGPKSQRIASALRMHPSLSEFASGVDERAIYSTNNGPLCEGGAYWSSELDDLPLVLAFHVESRDIFELYCIRAKQIRSGKSKGELHIEVVALVDVEWKFGEPDWEIRFLDENSPIQMRLNLYSPALATDIIALQDSGFHNLDDLVGRLVFIASVIADPNTQFTQER